MSPARRGEPSSGREAELVARALQGDAHAWESIVDRYGGVIYGIGRKSGLSPSDAEDLSQHVFTTLVASLGTLRRAGGLLSWIVVTSRRQAWRMRRQGRKHAAAELDESAAPIDAEPTVWACEAEGEVLARRQVIADGLAAIDARCAALLRAFFAPGAEPAYETVAASFGIAVNSVGAIRNRCLSRLEAIVRGLGWNGEGVRNSASGAHIMETP